MIIAAAALLRLESLHQVSLCHFDEGVYVSSAYRLASASPEGFAFQQAQHAPPLYPIILAGVYRVVGVAWPNLGLYVSALFGTATVVLVYAASRSMWNRTTALLAAGLLALSDYHVAFSRMALTDVPFTFWFSAAMFSAGHALQNWQTSRWRSRWLWVLIGGVASGCAWNTKYHGWLAPALLLVITCIYLAKVSYRAVGLRLSILTAAVRDGRFVAICMIAVLAGLSFLPWLYYVEQNYPGGYMGVTRMHQSYLGSIWQWPEHAFTLATSLPAFRHWGWLVVINIAIAGTLMLQCSWASRILVGLFAAGSVVVGSDLVVHCIVLPMVLQFGRSQKIELMLLGLWLAAFYVLTPFYTPYIRLLLPALPPAIMLAAYRLDELLGGAEWWRKNAGVPGGRLRSVTTWGITFGCVAALAVLQPFGWLPTREVWQRWQCRAGYQEFARWVADSTPANAAFLCQGQPPFSIYCPRQAVILGNEPFFEALRGLSPERPAYLALDFRVIHEAEPTARDGLLKHGEALELVHTISLDANVVVLLDYMSAEQVARKLEATRDDPYYIQDASGRRLLVPPPLDSSFRDIIAVYHIRR